MIHKNAAIETENKEKITGRREYLFLYLISFIFVSMFSIKLDTLYVSDELGTIANAAALCGISYKGINYYKYGQAILYYPLFKLFDNPNAIYQGAIFINNLLISSIPCCVYSISNSILGINKCNRKKSFTISIIIILLPSSLLWGRFIWSETTLYLVVWLSIYLLLKNLQAIETQNKKKQLTYNILLALVIIWGYASHQRGIVFIYTVLGTWLMLLLSYKKNILKIPFWVTLILGIVADYSFSAYLQTLVYDGNMAIGNTTESAVKQLLKNINLIFSPSGLATMLKLLCGWIFASICSTYGFFAVGLFVAVFVIALNFKKKCNKTIFVTALFSVMYLTGAIIIGLLFFFSAGYNLFYGDATDRLDKIIYARYLSGCFGPFMYLVLFDITHQLGIIKKYFFIITISILGIIGISMTYLMHYLHKGYISPIQMAPVPFLIKTSHGDYLFADDFIHNLLKSICLVLTIFFIFMLLIYLEKRKLFSIALSITFICSSLYTLVNVYQPTTARYRESIRIVDNFLQDQDFPKNIQFTSRLPRTNYAYMFAFPDYYTTSLNDNEICFIITNNNLSKLLDSGYCIVKEQETKYWGTCWILSKKHN